jgi:hypothetical protein
VNYARHFWQKLCGHKIESAIVITVENKEKKTYLQITAKLNVQAVPARVPKVD